MRGSCGLQRQSDLLVLGWGRNLDRGGLACDLHPARVSVRTRFVNMHNTGGRSSFVARPPAFMPSISLAVNPGIGWSPVSIRFNYRPEITVFEI